MSGFAITITAIVKKMTEMYESFRLILIQEQELLSTNKTAELKLCVEQKDKLAEEIASVEEKRLAAVIAASQEMGFSGKIAKLEEISALSGSSGQELMSARNLLLEVVSKVKALNSVNEQLLIDSMSYIKTAFDFVTGKQNKSCGYAMNGMTKNRVAVKRNLVNMQA
jgi:flagellar biosynthesis/type III secretory pathway chaperone